jgi:hypothetical protein
VERLILLFSERLIVVFKGSESSFGDFGIKELLVNRRDEINILDKISRRDSVLVDD